MANEECELKHAAMIQEIRNLKEEVNGLKTKQVILSESQIETKVKLDQVITTLNGLVISIQGLTSEPGKNWNNLVTTAVTSGIVGLISFVVGKFV